MRIATTIITAAVIALLAFTVSPYPLPATVQAQADGTTETVQTQAENTEAAETHVEHTADTAATESETAAVDIHLSTGFIEGKFVFVGVGGDIDGIINPELRVPTGTIVTLTLENGDAMEHDIVFGDLGVASDSVFNIGESTTVTFTASESGIYDYWCSIPGHRQIGMEGTLIVGDPEVVAVDEAPSLAKDPADMPGPIAADAPREIVLDLVTTERLGRLADGTNYTFWTFNDTVPGPFLRVRQGDLIHVNMHNDEGSRYAHSVDFHAVTGPGGGAAVTQTAPGETTSFSFTAMNPGIYVYHCATHSHAHHIMQGMYGLILVEPEGGLPAVDHEFYIMQGELYTIERFGSKGELSFDIEKMMDERAEWLFFNGATDALTHQYPMNVNVGETVRLYFGVGGPNYTSSFHIIGEIMDRVYVEGGSLINHNVQTTMVPAGGATIVEFQVDVPGTLTLVDHSLSRLERGLVGHIHVHGDEQPDLFRANDVPIPHDHAQH